MRAAAAVFPDDRVKGFQAMHTEAHRIKERVLNAQRMRPPDVFSTVAATETVHGCIYPMLLPVQHVADSGSGPQAVDRAGHGERAEVERRPARPLRDEGDEQAAAWTRIGALKGH